MRWPRTCTGSVCSFRFRAAPALLAFAAEAGAFAALGGQHVGVAGVGITQAQVVLQLAGQRGVIPVGEGPGRYLGVRPARMRTGTCSMKGACGATARPIPAAKSARRSGGGSFWAPSAE
jgi:hypothetical protein